MKKIFTSLVTIAVIGAIAFLGGEWPENTPIKRVVACDIGAGIVIALGGFYLLKEYEDGEE